jgi:hypothetical protein
MGKGKHNNILLSIFINQFMPMSDNVGLAFNHLVF